MVTETGAEALIPARLTVAVAANVSGVACASVAAVAGHGAPTIGTPTTDADDADVGLGDGSGAGRATRAASASVAEERVAPMAARATLAVCVARPGQGICAPACATGTTMAEDTAPAIGPLAAYADSVTKSVGQRIASRTTAAGIADYRAAARAARAARGGRVPA